jgi:hypothetical protein
MGWRRSLQGGQAEGLLDDVRLASNLAAMAIETIAAPTLAVSYPDEGFGTAAAARMTRCRCHMGQGDGSSAGALPDGAGGVTPGAPATSS